MPVSQSAFDLISADHASPRYSDSGFIARHAAWMASASRLATHRRSSGLREPSMSAMRRKMASPSRSGSQALTRQSTSARRISCTICRYREPAPRPVLIFHCQWPDGSTGSVSRLHLPQSLSL